MERYAYRDGKFRDRDRSFEKFTAGGRIKMTNVQYVLS